MFFNLPSVDMPSSDPVYRPVPTASGGWGGLLYDILGTVRRSVQDRPQTVIAQQQPSFIDQYGPVLLIGGLVFLLASSGRRRRR